MNETTFNIGDKVRHTSSSQWMIVINIKEGKLLCEWLSKNKRYEEWFNPKSLTKEKKVMRIVNLF